MFASLHLHSLRLLIAAAHVYLLKPAPTPFYSRLSALQAPPSRTIRRKAFDRGSGYPRKVSALVWWLIPLVACTGALIYVWWSISAKRRQNTYKSISEYETFRSAFAKDGREVNREKIAKHEIPTTQPSKNQLSENQVSDGDSENDRKEPVEKNDRKEPVEKNNRKEQVERKSKERKR